MIEEKKMDYTFCPCCGAKDTLVDACSAFVEMGDYDGKHYEFEGDARHYECGACGGQFTGWSADMAEKRARDELVGVVGTQNGRIVGALVKKRAFCVLSGEQSEDLVFPPLVDSAENRELHAFLWQELTREWSAHQDWIASRLGPFDSYDEAFSKIEGALVLASAKTGFGHRGARHA